MSKTSIEWTDARWNPVRGCSRVSEGCKNCYAERFAARFCKPGEPFYRFAHPGQRGPVWTGRVELIASKLDEPLRWRKPRRVFVNSMSDLFHEGLPDEAIDRVFAVMATAEQHTFQVLTKRPRRMLEWFGKPTHELPIWTFRQSPLANVWLGVSVEDQQRLDERTPLLLQTLAAKRFVSLEPLLGPVDFRSGWLRGICMSCHSVTGAAFGRYRGACDCGGEVVGLDQVIVGGESGPGARPMDVAWVRSVIRQCREAGVAMFCKQLGAKPYERVATGNHPGDWGQDIVALKLKHPKGGDPAEWPEDLRVREFPA